MTDRGSGTTTTTTRLPLADLPATVLPGAVITLALAPTSSAAPSTAPGERAGSRVLLRAGDDQLGVVAQVPDIGTLPDG